MLWCWSSQAWKWGGSLNVREEMWERSELMVCVIYQHSGLMVLSTVASSKGSGQSPSSSKFKCVFIQNHTNMAFCPGWFCNWSYHLLQVSWMSGAERWMDKATSTCFRLQISESWGMGTVTPVDEVFICLACILVSSALNFYHWLLDKTTHIPPSSG